MRRKRIGFFHGENEVDDEEVSKDSKFYVVKFIDSNYSSSGDTEQKEFKTSTELIYILRESIDVSVRLINEVMEELEYEMIFIDQVPNWVLYSKEILNDE